MTPPHSLPQLRQTPSRQHQDEPQITSSVATQVQHIATVPNGDFMLQASSSDNALDANRSTAAPTTPGNRNGKLRIALHLIAALMLTQVTPAQAPDFYDIATIRDVYLQFSQTNYWQQMEANFAAKTNLEADMTVDGVVYPDVGVRFRGETSHNSLPSAPQQGWDKENFKISMDFTVTSQDIQGYDNLNFNNCFYDPTFLREVMSFYVMRQHGVAPKANWIRLHINGTYWGLYVNAQQPNKDMFKEWFRSNDGNRYQCNPTIGGYQNGRCCYTWLGTNLTSYFDAYNVKQGDAADLMNICDVLNNTPSGTLQSVLPDVFNVDSFLRYGAVMNVITHVDSYLESGKDHFLYVDEVHGDGTTLPRSLNEGMSESATLPPTAFTTDPERPAFTQTLQFPDWNERYKAHYLSILEQTFNASTLAPLAIQWHAMISPDVVADTKKIYSTTAFQNNLQSSVTIQTPSPTPTNTNIPGLVPWIASRSNFLTSHAYLSATRPTLSNLHHTPAQPTPANTTYITVDTSSVAASVNLWSRTIGKFQRSPMFDDGLHGDGAANDNTWGIIVPLQSPGTLIDYYAEAVSSSGAARYEPFTAELERACNKVLFTWPIVPSDIVINEFVAQNVTGPVDENGQHEDWLELFNSGTQTIDVGGMSLSDSFTDVKWEIPANNPIPPNGVLRIWLDEDGSQGPLHANFKLLSAGENVILYSVNGTEIHDSFTFGQQRPDISTGRLLDGQSQWVTFTTPTYEQSNEIVFCGSRTYGALEADAHGIDIALSGNPQVNTTITYTASNGPANSFGIPVVALGSSYFDLGIANIDEVLLVSPSTLVVLPAVLLDGSGSANFDFSIPSGVASIQLNAQFLNLAASGWDSSPAIEIVICP